MKARVVRPESHQGEVARDQDLASSRLGSAGARDLHLEPRRRRIRREQVQAAGDGLQAVARDDRAANRAPDLTEWHDVLDPALNQEMGERPAKVAAARGLTNHAPRAVRCPGVAHGFVLVGGRSSRMGRDKALLPVGGVPMALLQARKLERLCTRVSFVGKEPGALAALGYPFVADGTDERAAIHGLVAALAASPEEECVVLAADLPFVPAELLEALRARREAIGAPAVVPWDGKGPQPLCSAWSTRALPALRASAATGDLSLHRALESAGALVLTGGETERLPGFAPGVFRNVNTPEEYRAVEEEGA